MAEPIRTPSAGTAAKIAEALARPDAASKGPGGVPGVTPTAIVRRGDEIGTSPVYHYEGWLRGHPELDPGEATDLGTEPVILVSLDGGELEEDAEYVAVRAGSDDGVPVYRTQAPDAGLAGLGSGTAGIDITTSSTWTNASGSNLSLSLPAGFHLVFATVAPEGQATGLTTGAYGMINVRLFNTTNSTVAGAECNALQFFGNSQFNIRTALFAWPIFLSVASTVRLQAWRNTLSPGTWVDSRLRDVGNGGFTSLTSYRTG